MQILCIDDDTKQLYCAAKGAVEAAGHEFKGILTTDQSMYGWMKQIEYADAVISELYFNPLAKGDKPWVIGPCPSPPAGLLVAIQAMAFKKPVALCTFIGGDYPNFGNKYGWIYEGYISPNTQFTKPQLTLIDDKDWNRAVRAVTRMHETAGQ